MNSASSDLIVVTVVLVTSSTACHCVRVEHDENVLWLLKKRVHKSALVNQIVIIDAEQSKKCLLYVRNTDDKKVRDGLSELFYAKTKWVSYQ